MSDFSNYLDDHEAERLAILAEEAGELVQAIGKILRHGYDSYNPDNPKYGNNREQLCRELGDLKYITDLMVHRGDIDNLSIRAYASLAEDKKLKYMHHQDGFTDHDDQSQ